MAQFKTIVEAVLRNSGGELDRVELDNPDPDGYYNLKYLSEAWILSVGDTITIEERQTEVE